MATASFNNETTINASLGKTKTINTNLTPINYIPGYKAAEEERRSNEIIRQSNEEDRITFYEDMQDKLESGYFNGSDGATFLPSVDIEGNISWTNNKGLVNPETRNIKGDKGDKGDKGEQGAKGEPGSIKYLVVSVLPTENIDLSAIYLVPSSTIATQNNYEEYVYINNQWEKIGSAVVDLANYMQKSTYDSNNNGIVDNAERVNNHTVEKDVPSNAKFTDTTYTAGNGIEIDNGVISNTSNIPDMKTEYSLSDFNGYACNLLNKFFSAIGLDQDTYNTSTNYAVGDMVIHDFRIWECTTACTGEWDETNWQVVPIIVNN